MITELAFGNLPDGEEWHNPDGLTPEQVGVSYGWRLLLKSEIGCVLEHSSMYINGRFVLWMNNHICEKRSTYRTKHPIGTLFRPKKEETIMEQIIEKKKLEIELAEAEKRNTKLSDGVDVLNEIIKGYAESEDKLKDNLADLTLKCGIQEQRIAELELLLENPNLDKVTK